MLAVKTLRSEAGSATAASASIKPESYRAAPGHAIRKRKHALVTEFFMTSNAKHEIHVLQSVK
jgi:hypothetical protein